LPAAATTADEEDAKHSEQRANDHAAFRDRREHRDENRRRTKPGRRWRGKVHAMTAPDLGGARCSRSWRVDAGWRHDPEIGCAVFDPDLGRGLHAGELVNHGEDRYVHRPWRTWVELAERLGLRLLTPRAHATASQLVVLRFERLTPAIAARPRGEDLTERYGLGSSYARISKLEDPGFVIDLGEALARCALGPAPRILDLGVNIGDELALIGHHAPELDLRRSSASTTASAIAAMVSHQLPVHRGRPQCAARLGLGVRSRDPPARFRAGIVTASCVSRPTPSPRRRGDPGSGPAATRRRVDGTRMKNFRQPELGLLVKDIAFYRKYLQQHHRQVFVTGKYYLLVTAVPTSAHTEQG
jgi:hypothetical protein